MAAVVLLGTRNFSTSFKHHKPIRKVFYGSEKLSSLPEVTQLVNDRAEV